VIPNRVRVIKDGCSNRGPVVYWMSRDQRVNDNWALVYARELAESASTELRVVFTLPNGFLGAEARVYRFMFYGLEQVEARLRSLGIGFDLLVGEPSSTISGFLESLGASILICDFDPLREKRRWRSAVAEQIKIPVHEVDAHNVVPVWVASEKQEYGAYTIRPKLRRLLPIYLDEPEHLSMPSKGARSEPTDWETIAKRLKVENKAPQLVWLEAGEVEALKALRIFIVDKLTAYPVSRNDPDLEGQSGLSPYLHFGQLSPQRLAYEVEVSATPRAAKDAFLEELITRRELSDNFCFYNRDYDSTSSFPSWARKTLSDHLGDSREYVYGLRELEFSETHDPLWNAAQKQMVLSGRMHGYLRMYWAKKILEWSKDPEEALSSALYLNDKYELDGRDPNGFVGCAWSIGGVHDRPWPERLIYGKIRFMSYSGMARKFNVDKYVSKINQYAYARALNLGQLN
jgi:deoxyribodipyrimidine photo-lyase